MLVNKLVVITRGGSDSNNLAALLKKNGAKPYKLPTIEVVKLKLKSEDISLLRRLGSYEYIIFTSAHAVTFFFAAVRDLKIPDKKMEHCRMLAVGPATARAIQKFGFGAQSLPERFTALDIVKDFGPAAGKKILLPRSAIASRDLPGNLQRQKASVSEIFLYTTRLIDKPDPVFSGLLTKKRVDYFTFSSPSGVAGFPGRVKNDILLKQALLVPAACIGPRTARAARKLGFKRVITARTFTAEGLVNSLLTDPL